MPIVSYDFANSNKPQRTRLAELVANNATLGDQSFNWLKPVVAETLEEAARRTIRDRPVPSEIWPLPADAQLAEASRLLDICLVQRREIYQLEAQAVMSALDICLARDTVEADRRVARAHFLAALRQTGATDPATLDLIDKKFEAQRQGVEERLRLHNQAGGALNYGERITFLRDIYGQNLGLAFERLMAAIAGGRFAYGLKLNFVDVDAIPGDLLESLVEVSRRFADLLEEGEYTEKVFDVLLHLGGDNIAPDLKTRFASAGPFGPLRGTFTLKPEHLKQDDAYPQFTQPGPNDAVRIIGLDLAFVCKEDHPAWVEIANGLHAAIGASNEAVKDRAAVFQMIDERVRQMRRTCTMRLSLTPPTQVLDPGDSQRVLSSDPVRFGMVPVWSEGPARDQFRPTATQEMRDRCPFGEWRYDIDGVIRTTDSLGRLGQIGPGGDFADNAWSLGMIQDVVLMLRLAVRRLPPEVGIS